jgi:hypothetical protein
MTSAPVDDARRILASETGGATSPELVAAGVVRACERFSVHLAPVIGDAGIRALLLRSLTLTTRRFTWLGVVQTSPTEPPWLPLRPRIAEQTGDTATEAALALLATFLGLLGKFIGDRLADRLVHAAWPAVFPADSQKETP